MLFCLSRLLYLSRCDSRIEANYLKEVTRPDEKCCIKKTNNKS